MPLELQHQRLSNVNTFDSEKLSKEAIEKIVEESFDLRPKSLLTCLILRNPYIFLQLPTDILAEQILISHGKELIRLVRYLNN